MEHQRAHGDMIEIRPPVPGDELPPEELDAILDGLDLDGAANEATAGSADFSRLEGKLDDLDTAAAEETATAPV